MSIIYELQTPMNYVRLQWLLVIIVTKYGLGIGLGKGWDQSLGQELELWLGIGLPGYLDFVFRVRVGTRVSKSLGLELR